MHLANSDGIVERNRQTHKMADITTPVLKDAPESKNNDRASRIPETLVGVRSVSVKCTNGVDASDLVLQRPDTGNVALRCSWRPLG